MHHRDIDVPDKFMGLVIGRQGQTLRYISDIYNVYIKIKGNGFRVRGETLNSVNLGVNHIKSMFMKKIKQENQCPICLEHLNNNNDFCVTECGHQFHTSCLLKSAKINGKCPLCRHPVLEDSVTMTSVDIERIINRTINRSIVNGTFYNMLYYTSSSPYIDSNSMTVIKNLIREPIRYALQQLNG
jgi:hypothetical protein